MEWVLGQTVPIQSEAKRAHNQAAGLLQDLRDRVSKTISACIHPEFKLLSICTVEKVELRFRAILGSSEEWRLASLP